MAPQQEKALSRQHTLGSPSSSAASSVGLKAACATGERGPACLIAARWARTWMHEGRTVRQAADITG